MCSSSIMNTVSKVTKPIGKLASAGIANPSLTMGPILSKVANPALDYAELQTEGMPIIGEGARIANETLTGTNLDDTRREIQNQMNYAKEGLETIGTAPSPFNIENEDEYLAALRAQYREDARARRYRGRAGTILTGGQGASGAATTATPTLSGRSIRFF